MARCLTTENWPVRNVEKLKQHEEKLKQHEEKLKQQVEKWQNQDNFSCQQQKVKIRNVANNYEKFLFQLSYKISN